MIKHSKIILLLIVIAIGGNLEARADSTITTIDASCKETVTVIIPIVGRPKGKEEVPSRTVLTERLAQETPCAWVDFESLDDVSKIVSNQAEGVTQKQLIQDLSGYVRESWKRFGSESSTRYVRQFSEGRKLEIRVYAGFFEEFFGNISLTMLDFRNAMEPTIVKRTVSEPLQTEGIAASAEFFREDSTEIFDEFIRKHERIPVLIDAVESQDKHPVSENLAQEIDLFLRSRLEFPLEKRFFERKPFFRLASENEAAAFRVTVRIRRDGIKFYASIVVDSNAENKRRTSWIEGELTQLPRFEEDLLKVMLENLSRLEGIFDYGVVGGPELLLSNDDSFRFVTLSFRQNRGNVAFSARARTGTKKFENIATSRRVATLGGAAGWQFLDVRWLSADAGLGLDLGFASESFKSAMQERSLLVSYGPYLQAQTILTQNFTILGRLGFEQIEQIKTKQDARVLKLSPFYVSAMVGGGVSF